MSDLMTIIKERRSVRKYEDRPVPDELLQQIMDSVKWAPSWANTQCWEIVVVKDPAVKERLQASLPPKGNPAFKAMVQAPVVLVLCGKKGISGFYKDTATTKHGDWMMFDFGIAAQNICLAAHSLGMGTVIVGLFDHNKAAEAVQLPESHELIAMIPLGFPAKSGSAPARKEIDAFVHYEKW